MTDEEERRFRANGEAIMRAAAGVMPACRECAMYPCSFCGDGDEVIHHAWNCSRRVDTWRRHEHDPRIRSIGRVKTAILVIFCVLVLTLVGLILAGPR